MNINHIVTVIKAIEKRSKLFGKNNHIIYICLLFNHLFDYIKIIRLCTSTQTLKLCENEKG